jgi:uncharacterized repeat protein (TIGR03806 family)
VLLKRATSPFTSVVARFKSTDGGKTLGPPDEIIKFTQPYPNHNGGNIQFGPDGMLYVGFGDGGLGNDPCGNGQQLDTKFGKLLRIDVSAPAGAYEIPADNPFVSTPGADPAIWSFGHRNPWRWSFDRATGDLWLGDVGEAAWEEIDRVTKGGNYGWSKCEGFHKAGSATELCQQPGLLDPVVEHPRTDASCIIGGYVYRGNAIPALVGTYLYSDYMSGNIWALRYDKTGKPSPAVVAKAPPTRIVSFGQGNDGELYVVFYVTGQIFKVVPGSAAPPSTFPTLLSRSGCVDPTDATKPAQGLIPYDVASPLWSDGARKERWFAIPDGKTIAVGPDGDWDLPVGSVAMKTFSVDDRRVETRLFMHHTDGWAGYTYAWNDAQTDATLLPAADAKRIGQQTWTFPSRSQCLQCHSAAAGGTIGLETGQLNRDLIYAATNRISNQLATLDHLGLFSSPIGDPPKVAALPDPSGADALEARARSYLHANCSHCHRPSGGGQGTMDLRFGTSLKDTQTCNAAPTQGQVEGVRDATILLPGVPAKSILSLRVHASDSARMPPVAVSAVDPLGSALIDQWIASVGTCP